MAIGSANPGPTHPRVGDLVVRRWLASGGMAELYLATPRDPARAREVVVLKRVLPQYIGHGNFVRMFAREAKLASMLHHPNIVQVHDIGGLGDDDCFFTMEYVHGVDLGALLERLKARGGALPLAHALTVAVAMCAGLHFAHEAKSPEGQPLGIVHRDVSPSNVLLGFDGAIKVTDFGVAKALAMTRLTEEGTRKGKLSYMSPEQATGESVDRRADVFAIATVLYEMTTMERLFGGDNDLAVMYNIIERPRPRPREVSPGYPAALEEIVLRAVSVDIAQRYPTAMALQQALEQFAASVGLSLGPDAMGTFLRQSVPAAVHPGEDPKLLSESITLPAPAVHPVTAVQTSDEITLAESSTATPTGPNPPVPPAPAGAFPTGPFPAGPLPGMTAPTGPFPSVPAPTGPFPSVPGAFPTGPVPTAPAPTGPFSTVPAPVGPFPEISGAGAALTPAWTGSHPAVAPTALQKWSLVLAMMALLVAVAVGVMVWQASTREPAERPGSSAAGATSPDGAAQDGANPNGTAQDGANPNGANPNGTAPDGTAPNGANPNGANPNGAASDGAAPDGTAPDGSPAGVAAPAVPGPSAEPVDPDEPGSAPPDPAPDASAAGRPADEPAAPASSSSRRRSKRRTKKRGTAPASDPADPVPPPEPASKKPSPTDTLLPIRE